MTLEIVTLSSGVLWALSKLLVLFIVFLILNSRLNRLEASLKEGLKDMEAGIRASIRKSEAGWYQSRPET